MEVLQAGGVVAFPTETVYGLCVDPGNAEAVKRLYELKGRDAAKSCAYLLGDIEQASVLTPRLPPSARRLAEAFWPGPLTLVVPGSRRGRIGLRLPSVPLARALARQFGSPLLQTSANKSGEPAALNSAGILRAFGEGVDLLLDAGRAEGGVASTVVACDGPSFEILREGAIPEAEVAAAAIERIVLVCTGNICRSPTAEYMLRDITADRIGCDPVQLPERAFVFSSCGTHGWTDAEATDEAIKSAGELGYDLQPHRSQPYSLEQLGTAHRVWCMSKAHVDALETYFQDRPEALQLLDPEGGDVADPFRRSMRFYRKTARQIEKLCRRRAEELAPTYI